MHLFSSSSRQMRCTLFFSWMEVSSVIKFNWCMHFGIIETNHAGKKRKKIKKSPNEQFMFLGMKENHQPMPRGVKFGGSSIFLESINSNWNQTHGYGVHKVVSAGSKPTFSIIDRCLYTTSYLSFMLCLDSHFSTSLQTNDGCQISQIAGYTKLPQTEHFHSLKSGVPAWLQGIC